MRPRTILFTSAACGGIVAFTWLLLQVNQLKVQARSLEAALEQSKSVPLFVQQRASSSSAPGPVPQMIPPQAAEPIEIGDIMTKLQRHANKLYFAGEHRNWELAAFYLEEVEETVKGIANKEIMEGQVNISGLMQALLVPEVETLEEKLQHQNVDEFRKQYSSIIKGCNTCHELTKHRYLKIIEPRTPIFDNQVYDPLPPETESAPLAPAGDVSNKTSPSLDQPAQPSK